MKPIKAAIVQWPTAVLDLNEGIARAETHIREAGRDGANLVIFPESWLTGYPAWVFGMAGWDNEQARYWYGRFLQECPTVDSEALMPIRQAAKDMKLIVSLGFSEKIRPDSGTAYNSILLIGRDGKNLNVHRKLTPTHTEKIVWGQGDASGLRVIDTEIGKIGGLVCWEHWHPLIRQAMHSQDEQIHIACWPDMPDSHGIATRHYAFEGRCFVAAAAQYLSITDVPDALLEAYRIGIGHEAASGDVLLRGGSAFAQPDGSWIAPQIYDAPQFICAEIDLSATQQFKHDIDVVGHYSRADIFQLSVDCSVRQSVNWKQSGRSVSVDDCLRSGDLDNRAEKTP